MNKDKRDFIVVMSILLIFSAFFYGGLSVQLQIFPYKIFKSSFEAASALKEVMRMDQYNLDIRWTRVAAMPRGLILDEPEKTAPGNVVYVSGADTTARLIDSKGEILHTWNADYSKVWGDDQSNIISLFHLDDSYFYLRDLYLYENGDIVLIVSAGGTTPWGVGLVRLDKDSKVLWKYTAYANNDFEVAADGTIYAIVHKIRNESVELAEKNVVPFLEDNIVQLSAEDGREIKTISLIGALEASPYKGLLKHIENVIAGDPTHSNAIEEVGADVPGVPWLKKGYLVISVRNLSALVVLDPSGEGRVVYAATLPARMQHDVDLLPDGHLMFFDNRGDLTPTGYSRIIELDPRTLETVWSYNGDGKDHLLESKFWGAQQRFENGNTLVVDAEQGRILEVQLDGSPVWEYRSPLMREYDGAQHAAVITHAEKVSGDMPFLKEKR